MPETPPLLDSYGRPHADLRISVTDRCNIRCFYCMPNEHVIFQERSMLLTFEEIERFVKVAAKLGIRKLRLTGGEPLVRRELPVLIEKLAKIETIEDIALTTNGLLLSRYAQALKDAGLHRLNISLDALSAEKFERITRRKGFRQVLDGIHTAQAIGFEKIKINAVAIAGLSEEEIVPFGHFAREQGLEVRFIEFMPLDAEQNWQSNQVLSGEKIITMLSEAILPLVPCPRPDPSQPATDYQFEDGRGRIGFINPVTQPFCSTCNRLRITAEGQIRNCLFSQEEWDARSLMRKGGTDQELSELIRACVLAKKAGHGIHSEDFHRPARAMYQIGG
ncbi:Cyclic pyranopterin phosphate synthase (MoaA) [Planctomycetales bacterium 10988]|nr:Cyclic pyranopterin phosphate synthase (MoaA) [Planctomycetales bacterium 10988]